MNEQVKKALEAALGCFDAAWTEGLNDRLAEHENDPGSLRDLIERRVLIAPEHIREALSALQSSPVGGELERRLATAESLAYVPGVKRCAKCNFRLVHTALDAHSGRIAAIDTPEPCPNGCGPLWRITERDAGNELCDRLDDAEARASKAEAWAKEQHASADRYADRASAAFSLAREKIAGLLAALSTPEGTGGNEVSASDNGEQAGWLIELVDGPSARWITLTDGVWTTDSNKALRFARKEDAEAYWKTWGGDFQNVEFTEHMWVGSALQSAQSAPVSGGNETEGEG